MNISYRFFHGPTDWGWVQSIYPMLRIDDMCGLMAVDTDTNETVACALFDTFLDNTAQCSLIITNSMVLRHGFLEEAAMFLFDGLDKDFAFCKVSENNTRSLRICKRVGWKEVGRLQGGSANGKAHIMLELSKEDCTVYEPFIQSEVA